MKFIIAVDLEGLTCVVGSRDKTLTESPDYPFACRQGVREANAAAKALFDMGAEEVIVWDNHGGSLNLPYEELDRRCGIVLGSGESHRWPGMDKTYTGVLMIGYHPMDNTIDGVLAHTYNSKTYQWIKINGVEVGEIEIDAAVAGECFQVPLIFVASDDKGTAEAKRFQPWIETVTTKTGLGRNIAISKHPLKVTDEIYEALKRAVGRIEQMKPFIFDTPVEVQKRYKRLEDAEGFCRCNPVKCKRIDAYTVQLTVDRISDIY